jgi:hypothetical protein
VKHLEEEFRSQNPEFRRKAVARRRNQEKKGQRSGRLKKLCASVTWWCIRCVSVSLW